MGVIYLYKLLVVDDEQKIREIISKYAQFEGFAVEEAPDGLTAVEMFKDKDYDLIILDVMMPDLDGFSVCKELRKFSRTPVIMLSARGEEFDRIHGFEVGIDDYVVKPFSPKELMMRAKVSFSVNARALKTPPLVIASIVLLFWQIYTYSG